MQLSETELRIKKDALLQEFNKLSSLKNVKFPEAKIAFGKFSEIIISDEQKELEYKLTKISSNMNSIIKELRKFK